MTRPAVTAASVKKTISLPLDLAEEAETRARGEGKTLSAVIPGALRLPGELWSLQGHWSKKAKERGILTERALARYLEE